MSKKLEWMKFYPADWTRDTIALSLPARGAWITILCVMWNSETRGVLTLPIEGYGRLLGGSPDDAEKVISELVSNKICDARNGEIVTDTALRERYGVTERNKLVTLVCRRMQREGKLNSDNALRQARFRAKHRSNAPVTAQTPDLKTPDSRIKENTLEIGVPISAPNRQQPDSGPQQKPPVVFPKKGARQINLNHPAYRVKWDADALTFSGILDSDRAQLSEAFPACDVAQCIVAARAWMIANPCKTKKNVWRFLTNWIARQQERGGVKPSNSTVTQQHKNRQEGQYAQQITPKVL